MARAGDLIESDVDAGLFHRRIEQLALVEWHREILLAMHDEKGRRLFRRVRDWVGAGGLRGVSPGSGRRRGAIRANRVDCASASHPARHAHPICQKVGRTEEIHDGLHPAGLVRVTQRAFEIGHATCDAEQT